METTATLTADTSVGGLLRAWRERRRLSQMTLALDAEISTRHLSFLETGRARPSREMVLRLAEHLRVPLREQNALLLAAGFAPQYPQRALADASLRSVRDMVQRVLDGHAPYPALAIDRYWNLQAANRAVMPLLAGVDAKSPGAARERAPAESAAARFGPADRELSRVARPSPGSLASRSRTHGRCSTLVAVGRAGWSHYLHAPVRAHGARGNHDVLAINSRSR